MCQENGVELNLVIRPGVNVDCNVLTNYKINHSSLFFACLLFSAHISYMGKENI